MEIVANLQRQPVHARGKLHVDDVLAIAEMDPRRRLRNLGARRQAIGIDADVIVPERRPVSVTVPAGTAAIAKFSEPNSSETGLVTVVPSRGWTKNTRGPLDPQAAVTSTVAHIAVSNRIRMGPMIISPAVSVRPHPDRRRPADVLEALRLLLKGEGFQIDTVDRLPPP